MSEGYCKGDVCARDGCKGIIDEHEKEGGCSCHINPPCGYCTTQPGFCETCGWDAEDEQIEYEKSTRMTDEQYKKQQEQWDKERKAEDERREIFWKKYRGELPVDKVEIRCESHTHFSMKNHCVFPIGTKFEDLLPQLRGTFGGRLERMGNQSLTYIAYTD